MTIEDIIDTPRAPTPASGRARVARTALLLDTPGERLSLKVAHTSARIRPRDTDQRALFLTNRRDGKDYVPLTPHGIQTLFRRFER